MTITERLRAILCDPEGEPCFHGSDADRNEAKLALADLERLEAGSVRNATDEWSPMETAPKDGRDVIVLAERHGVRGCFVGHYMPGGHCIEDHPPIDQGWYFWNGRMFDIALKPILWMPLRALPVLEKKG